MIKVIQFDFSYRQEKELQLDDLQPSRDEAIYFWILADEDGVEGLPELLERLKPGVGLDVRHLRRDLDQYLDKGPEFLAFNLVETWITQEAFVSKPLRIVLGRSFMITLFEEGSPVVQQVLGSFSEDFRAFAKSPGFLLFELIDSLTNIYQETFRQLEDRVDRLQVRLLRYVDQEIFFNVSEATRQLLDFRLCVVSAREIVHLLATRKSHFVSETTQPFLERNVALLERLSGDLSVQRAVISDTLNLYMGFVSYRTNQIINRLTVISLIFLPLTFLVGVYGMNFTYMPEIDWRYSYLVFWIVVAVIVVSLMSLFRRKRWLD